MWARQAQRVLSNTPHCNRDPSLTRARRAVCGMQPQDFPRTCTQRLRSRCNVAAPGAPAPAEGTRALPAQHHTHSVWQRNVVCMGRRSAKIALRKGKSDLARCKVYAKIGKQIAQAARAGGTDPAENSRLRDLMNVARAANVPKDIVDRNLKRAADAKAADFTEIVYECYGHGKSGFVIEALTDNVNRSATNVKIAINKFGGKVADSGSVAYNFRRCGVIMVDASHDNGSITTEDEVLEGAMDAGADDIQDIRDEDGTIIGFKVVTPVELFMKVWKGLEAGGVPVREGSLQYLPLSPAQVSDEDFHANEKLLEGILADDDVDAVYTTCAGLEHH